MIELKNVSKSFGSNTIVSGVSAQFEKGKINMVIGASGSGKSVLMKCMVGLHPLSSGQILYDGISIGEMSAFEKTEIRKKVGMLFQNSALFDSMTVEENIIFPLNMFSTMPLSEKLDRVNFCLKRVGLEGKNKLFPAEVSGGMKKRVGIARAIVLNPTYLFVDEPNSGLDPLTSILIDELIKELTTEYNMITVVNTHDMNSVMETGDKILFLHKGKKTWEGNKTEILLTDNEILNEFVFATSFLKDFKSRQEQKVIK